MVRHDRTQNRGMLKHAQAQITHDMVVLFASQATRASDPIHNQSLVLGLSRDRSQMHMVLVHPWHGAGRGCGQAEPRLLLGEGGSSWPVPGHLHSAPAMDALVEEPEVSLI